MAEQGTLKGELQRGWHRFWGMSWKWKAPILAILAIIVLGAIGSAGGSSDKAPAKAEVVATVAGTPKPTAEPKATDTPKPTNIPKPTETPKPAATPAPPTPTPEPAGYTFGSGKKLVGSEVAFATKPRIAAQMMRRR